MHSNPSFPRREIDCCLLIYFYFAFITISLFRIAADMDALLPVTAICRYTELNSRCTCTSPVGWPLAISELSGDDRIFSRRHHRTKYSLGNLPEIYMSLTGSGSRYNRHYVEFRRFSLKNRSLIQSCVSQSSCSR